MSIRDSVFKLPSIVLANSTVDEIATTFLGLPPIINSIVTVGPVTYLWTGDRWVVPERFVLEDLVRIYMGKCSYPSGPNNTAPLDTPAWRISAVLATVKAYRRVDLGGRTLPIWVGPGESPVSEQFSVALEDVVLDLKTGQTVPRDRNWLDPVVLPVTLADIQNAKTPERFVRCLRDWGEGDEDWQELLLRMTAYLLMPYRDLQRAFLMVGKRRAGKGVWSRWVRKVLGRGNVFSTDMEKFAYTHGLEGADTARTIFLNEVGASDSSISGQVRRKANEVIGRDETRINPKGLATYGAVLPGAVVMVGNEVPEIEDETDSFWSKVIIVPYRVSFLDAEDFDLEDRLWEERAGILAMVLAAGTRLLQDRRFPKVEASKDTREMLRRTNSQIDAFLEDRCVLDARKHTNKDRLYRAYTDWAEFYEVQTMPRVTFFKKLSGSTHPVRAAKRGPKGAQVQVIQGLGLDPLKDRQE